MILFQSDKLLNTDNLKVFEISEKSQYFRFRKYNKKVETQQV